jgi:hypothetical protein
VNGTLASARTGSRVTWWLALLVVVLVAACLRMHDITSFRVGPDDGSYMHSARLHELARGGNPFTWLREDFIWAREIASLYDRPTESYQHSYLHQIACRWLYRMGFDTLESLRMSSAILGSLTTLAVAWFVRRVLPGWSWLAVLAAAFVAVSPLHAFLSRTGWGQAGFTFWYVAFLAVAYRALIATPEPDACALRRAALALTATSVLAFGWHEGVVFYIAGTALVALFAPWVRGEPWHFRAALTSRRTWTYVAGAAVVGGFTIALFFSEFARTYWMAPKGRAPDSMPWIEVKWRTLQNLFVDQRPDLGLTWAMLVLAVLGALWLRRVDRTAFRWIAANAVAGPILVVFLFGDLFLLRAYLPSVVLLLVFSACGVAWIAERFNASLAAVVGSAVLFLTAATTWQTLFGAHDGPLFVQKLYDQTNDLDHRHVDEQLYALLLRERKPDELVAVFHDKACIYELQDRGIRAREDYMEDRPIETWPVWIVGVQRTFEASRFFEANGGPYTRRATDAVGRHALYERVGR